MLDSQKGIKILGRREYERCWQLRLMIVVGGSDLRVIPFVLNARERWSVKRERGSDAIGNIGGGGWKTEVGKVFLRG